MLSNEFQALYLFALYVRFTSDTQDWVALDDEWTSQHKALKLFFLKIDFAIQDTFSFPMIIT